MSAVDDLVSIFNKPTPRAPTTDWMDGIRDEKSLAEKYHFHAQCEDCGDWTAGVGSAETYGHMTKDVKCEHCGKYNLDPQSITSKRTFNHLTAKKRKPKSWKYRKK